MGLFGPIYGLGAGAFHRLGWGYWPVNMVKADVVWPAGWLSESELVMVEIASYVIQCQPQKMGVIIGHINQQNWGEITNQDPNGKLIMVYESDIHQVEIGDLIPNILGMKGVLTMNMVYHSIIEPDDKPPTLH